MQKTATRQPPTSDGEYYRLVFETIPHMVWVTTPRGELEFCNAGCRAYFGCASEELCASVWQRGVHAEDLPECLQRWNWSLRAGEIFDVGCRLRGADGQFRWHRGRALPVRGADGSIVRWFGTWTDIDGQLRAGHRLEEVVAERTAALLDSEARFKSLLALSSDWYWEQDSQYRFTSVTHATEKGRGVFNQNPIGKLRWDGEVLNMGEADWAAHRATLDARLPFRDLVLCRRNPNGGVTWAAISGEPVFTAAGAFVGYRGVARDITAQRRAEEGLRASEQRFQAFMDHSPAIAWIKDAELRYTYVSGPFLRLLNRKREELIGRTDLECWPEAEEAARRTYANDLVVQRERRALQAVETAPMHADGTVHHWLSSKFPLADQTGGVGVAGTAIEITERVQAEEALRASEQRFQAFMDHSPAIAWIKDAQLRYSYVSEPFLRQLKKKRSELIGKTVVECWPDASSMFDSDRLVQRERRSLQVMDAFPLGDEGPMRYWVVSKFPFADETGALGVAGVSLDITERVEAEREARELLDRLIAAQESERKRLATELHDLIGQNLTALGISLANLGAGGAEVERMRRTVEQTIEAIRGVMSGLRPPGLDEYGLLPALRAYAAEFQLRTGLLTSVEVRGFACRLAGRVETSIFRIVQEALTNAAKHSGGAAVQVLLEEADGALTVQVEDDGRGFVEPMEVRRPSRGGWGLRAIRERAQACGGTLRVENAARGARLIVQIPLTQDPST